MRTIRDSWFMIQADFRGEKMKMIFFLLFSILFTLYLAFFIGMLINDSFADKERTAIADFMMLSMIPLLGFTYSRRSFKYLSEDSYTKMLAYFHSLPIPASVILCKRKLQAIFSFSLNGFLFFGLVYVLGSDLRAEMSLLPYIVFALTWIGYGLIFTGVYIMVELMFNGKIYFIITFLILAVCGVISALIKLAGGNLLYYSSSISKEYGFLSPLMWGTLVGGVISLQLFSKWTIHRLKKRDLL